MIKKLLIPIEKTDEGIKLSIYNSMNLLIFCESIFYDETKYLDGTSVPKTQNYEHYSIVLYYYALEELTGDDRKMVKKAWISTMYAIFTSSKKKSK